MPIFRCDYKVVGDLVLPTDKTDLQFVTHKDFTMVFRNGEVNEEGHTIDLLTTMIGPATSIDSAEKEFRSVLTECLDLLTFSTHSRFKIVQPIRLVEWEEWKKKRNFIAFHKTEACYPPDPELVDKFVDTLLELERCEPLNFTKTALKYFRYGLLDEQPEDQHMRLWLALEIIAENLKEKESIPILCPVCESVLRCDACGVEPMRVPMAKQAIENLIWRVMGEKGKTVARRQFETRNGLMHGRSVNSIEKKAKMRMSDLANELGYITWNAIMSTFTLKEDVLLNFGHRGGDFTNKYLIMSVHGYFEYTGDTPHPDEDSIPNVNISLQTSFRTE